MSTFEAFLLAVVTRSPFLVGETAATVSGWKRKRDREESTAGSDKAEQSTREEVAAWLQKFLVDAPLQPLGVEHALYHVLIPAFAAAMDAARETWRATQALRAAEEGATNEEVPAGGESERVDGKERGAQAQQLGLEVLRRAATSARAKLNAQRRGLDVAHLKMRVLIESVGRHNATMAARGRGLEE